MTEKMNVGILITGNEVLSAKTKDTNGPFIGMYLRKTGIRVRASMMCADKESDLLDCLNYLSKRCDVILTTGGLGPTSDDLTAEVLAKFFGCKTIFFAEAWENCLQAYKKFNRTNIPESNKKQAFLPEGASILANNIGTAVGFKITGTVPHSDRQVCVYCMPGVPYEMEEMFLNEVYPGITKTNFIPVTQTWQVFLMGESAMQSAIDTAEKKLLQKFSNAAISYQAHSGFVTYSVTLLPQSEADKIECINYLESEFTVEVKKSFHKHILYSQDKKLAEYLIESFQQKKITLAFIEGSCGGALSKEIFSHKNAEDVLKGAVIVPQRSAKNILFLQEFDFMQEDICVTEWGAPSAELATQENAHGNFHISILIKSQKIRDALGLLEKLRSYGWSMLHQGQDATHNEDTINFTCETKVSTRYAKEVQQSRVALHCLCSLALIVKFL